MFIYRKCQKLRSSSQVWVSLPAKAEVYPGHEDYAGGREVDVKEVVAQGPLHVEGGLKLGDLPAPGENLAPAPSSFLLLPPLLTQ